MNSKKEVKFFRIRKVNAPLRKHKTDSGYDFFLPYFNFELIKESKIVPNEYANDINIFELFDLEKQILRIPSGIGILIPSGIKLILPPAVDMLLYPRSSATLNKGLLTDGVIDNGYTGEFKIPLLNFTRYDVYVKSNERYVQGVFRPVAWPLYHWYSLFEMREIDEHDFIELEQQKDRLDKGFGSSGV